MKMARVNQQRRRPRIVMIRPRKKWQFRWQFLLIPLALITAVWFLGRIDPAITWDEVMDALGVRNRERYTQLAVMGIALIGVATIWRIIRGSRNEEE